MKKLSRTFVMVIALLAIAGPAAWAGAAKMSIDPGRVQWDAQVEYERAVLTVSMPGGEVVRQEFGAQETPVFDLAVDAKDGAYTYELRLVPHIDASLRKALAEARRTGDEAAMARLRAQLPESPVVSGGFTVQAGAIVMPEGKEPQADKGPKSATAAGSVRNVTAADQVIPDDLIVQGSECVGLDCVNNENFGFDTIRLKENNLRIHFDDTSTSAGFPANDWRLIANDSASGGSSKFSIEDSTSSKTPFTITAGAATNSIFADSTGRIGLRTSTPVLDLHINTSNTPAIRLEQNNSGGFTAQTWDIGANEANFFVRDVTGGSKLSFRIRPGAPTSSIDISADGDVGIGTASPSNKVHVLTSTSGTTAGKVMIENTNATVESREALELQNDGGPVTMIFKDSTVSERWVNGTSGSNFVMNNQANPGVEFTLSNTGSLTITGTYTPASSRTIKEEFNSVEPREVLRKVLDMPITTWNYKREPGVRHIGPMSEDFFAAFAVGADNKGISVTDSAGVTLAAIQGLNQVVQDKDKEIADLKSRIETLEKLVQGLAQEK